jgi:hypothetical protein
MYCDSADRPLRPLADHPNVAELAQHEEPSRGARQESMFRQVLHRKADLAMPSIGYFALTGAKQRSVLCT